MGRASRLKRDRREFKLDLPPNLVAELRGTRVRINSGRHKISESLAELIQPFTSGDTSVEEFRRLVALGAMAWNLSVVEGSTPEQMLDLVEDLDASDRELLASLLSDLVLRKQSLFPDDQRFVAAWNVVVRPDGRFFLTAAAAGVK